MTDFLQPLRLAVGSHQAGSGKGCTTGTGATFMRPRTHVYVELGLYLIENADHRPDPDDASAERLAAVRTWLETRERTVLWEVSSNDTRAGILLAVARGAAIAERRNPSDNVARIWQRTCGERDMVDHATALFDEFDRLTGRAETPTPAPDFIDQALARMLATDKETAK